MDTGGKGGPIIYGASGIFPPEFETMGYVD